MLRRTLVAVLAATSSVLADRHYTIVNNCPLGITLYINGESQGPLTSGAQTTRDFPNTWSGFIYTDFNQGNVDGAGTVRAGFFGDNNFYYIVTDPNWQNVGVSIHPVDRAPKGGFCLGLNCEYQNCPVSYTSPPSRFPSPQGGVPPSPPLYECPVADTGYRVTYDCNGTQAQKWVIKRGGQQIKVSGTNFCLDAGSNPASGVGMKIWTCYDNLAAQQWTYTPDNLILLTNQGQCVDLPNGVLTNGNQVQTWACTNGNTNQIWTIG